MFFTSYEFLFIFLPIALLGFMVLHKLRWSNFARYWLVFVSLVFYWSLDGRHISHLLVSIGINYIASVCIYKLRTNSIRFATRVMWAGICFNIGFLIWFKYADYLLGYGPTAAIPLGISFFTIQQIAYLVSTFNDDEVTPTFSQYLLFVSFFPYVIAGPIVTKGEVIQQLREMSEHRAIRMLMPALTLFAIGLFKKVVFADNIGEYVDLVYAAATNGKPLSTADAWSAAMLYTLQIYFDFSGYSDMAAGLAGMFGLRLPRNFHSPLKACSIMEFWRRWHMSATRFFTNHFYLPLVMKFMRLAVRWQLSGANRFLFTVLLPMLVTFFLIGIWHGAGMTAVVFGLMMGVAISINHIWIKLSLPALPRWCAWLITSFVVV